MNQPIVEAGTVEYRLDPGSQDIVNREWVRSGIYFRFPDLHLEIFNGLDCNGLSDTPDREHPVHYVPADT